MRRPFFECSKTAIDRTTALFDFVWPAAAALWNLRVDVTGYVAHVPNATIEQLYGRFVEGSNINGANLRRASIEHTWEQQQEQFASIIATNVFALYEAWTADLRVVLSAPNSLEKHLQFPTAPDRIARLITPPSTSLRDAFQSTLARNPKVSSQALKNLLLCYRYFKEVRNCRIHFGGVADAKVVKAYNQFNPVANAAALGTTPPQHYQPVLGQEVKLSLHGVVGLSDVLLRIISTVDAELSQSPAAEGEFVRRWSARFPGRLTAPGAGAKRIGWLQRKIRKLGFPTPADALALCELLRRHQLAYI